MKSAPKPSNESERIQLLEQLKILDTLSEQAYDDLTFLAAHICQTPIALVSLVDHDRQWFKSRYGLEATETPRALAFCAHAILDDSLFLVENSHEDERFFDNPLVTGPPNVAFYAGEPLTMDDDIRLGTLCVIDSVPRTLDDRQKSALKALARQVTAQLKSRMHVQELERLDRAKDEFLSIANHELRTPLTAINGSLRLMKHSLGADELAPEKAKMLDIALRNTDRLLGIVNNILDIAKLESGRMNIDKSQVDLTTLVQRAVDLNEPYCTTCKCSLRILPGATEREIWVNGDEERLLQVLANLLSNAAKFTAAGDVIDIGVEAAGASAKVWVTNHGEGISPEDQPLLFKRFSTARKQGNAPLPGSGLGLAICKQIIDLHGGTIGFESVVNQATTFWFSLPLLPDGEAQTGEAEP